jgi:hypothetical protein
VVLVLPGKAAKIKSLISPSGAIAQLGERVVRNDEAVGSIPTSSTIKSNTYNPPVIPFCPKLVQNFNRMAAVRSRAAGGEMGHNIEQL